MAFSLREAIISYRCAAAQKLASFGIAAGSSFFVAACSSITTPVSSLIYYGGTSVKAISILPRLAPAINIPSCDMQQEQY